VSPAGTPAGQAAALAAAVRRINSVLVGRPLDADALAEATAAVAAVADRLEAAAGPGKLPRGDPAPGDGARNLFPTSPVIGRANPVAPPVEIWSVDGDGGRPELRGRAWFDYPYEGPPTCVHGGVIASVFDELLGAANIVAGTPGMTGTLTVVYRRPTPILTPLDLVARQTGVDGRKIRASAAIYHNGELTAEADGVFVAVDAGTIARIATENARAAGGDVVDADLAADIERAQIARVRPSQ